MPGGLIVGTPATARHGGSDISVAAAAGPHFDGWVTAQKIDELAENHADLNTAAVDGCPIQSPDGLSLYLASNRPGGKGGLRVLQVHPPRASNSRRGPN